MDIFYIVLAHILWFAVYFAVMRVGLYIEDRIHKSAVKNGGRTFRIMNSDEYLVNQN